VNSDEDIGDLMKVVYIPNYSVTVAQVVVPAADINEQISMAGTEASGTSNMKLVMNGSIIIGTLGGANVEIAKEVGEDNLFIFGARLDEIHSIKEKMKHGHRDIDPRLQMVFDRLCGGQFGNSRDFCSVLEGLKTADEFLVTHDFPSYCEAQERVDAAFMDKAEWARRSIWDAMHMGKHSSDRTIEEYAAEVLTL
jgi:starch phosphorylase